VYKLILQWVFIPNTLVVIYGFLRVGVLGKRIEENISASLRDSLIINTFLVKNNQNMIDDENI